MNSLAPIALFLGLTATLFLIAAASHSLPALRAHPAGLRNVERPTPSTVQSQSLPEGWTTLATSDFTISYPAKWTAFSSASSHPYYISLRSPDFVAGTEQLKQRGVVITMYVGNPPYPPHETLGLRRSVPIRWLETEALLQVYDYERYAIVLTANQGAVTYQMVMLDRPEAQYEQLFLVVANTVRSRIN